MSLKDDIRQVEQLKGAALRERYRQVVGVETRSNNRPYLIKSIVKKLEERRAESAPNEAPQQEKVKTDNAAPEKTAPKAKHAGQQARSSGQSRRKRDHRLPPPGSIVEKEHDGKAIRVEVLEDGFLYKGEGYRSLSAIAKAVTGTVWNGFLFFKEALVQAKERANQAA
jgi:hypothetical protein